MLEVFKYKLISYRYTITLNKDAVQRKPFKQSIKLKITHENKQLLIISFGVELSQGKEVNFTINSEGVFLPLSDSLINLGTEPIDKLCRISHELCCKSITEFMKTAYGVETKCLELEETTLYASIILFLQDIHPEE